VPSLKRKKLLGIQCRGPEKEKKRSSIKVGESSERWPLTTVGGKGGEGLKWGKVIKGEEIRREGEEN